jgi:Ser/Thr protein kinase RdoA (MazF antagonist)
MTLTGVVLPRFRVPGTLVTARRFGSGLINDTFLCEYEDQGGRRTYVLQRINTSVFTEPVHVMENVERVTTHIVDRLRRDGVADPEAVTPALVRTLDGASYFVDLRGGFWRAFHFIESCTVYDRVADPRLAREIGRALGRFQSLVADLPPAKLHDTLPDFHHTDRYLGQYDEALRSDAGHRARGVGPEQDVVEQHRSLATALTGPLAAGTIPVRVVHNDPKVNNVMIHAGTGEAVCMVDLDTVKSGTVLFDFGDCVRSAANPLGEDAQDLDAVRLDLALFAAIAEGYLAEARSFLTPGEIVLLTTSVKVITFELGLRFLTDHLRGDAYFRIRYPGHNLHRARVQFRLLERVEANEEKMRDIIGSILAKQ